MSVEYGHFETVRNERLHLRRGSPIEPNSEGKHMDAYVLQWLEDTKRTEFRGKVTRQRQSIASSVKSVAALSPKSTKVNLLVFLVVLLPPISVFHFCVSSPNPRTE
jgi:hypothetical protein